LRVPKPDQPYAVDLSTGHIATFLGNNSDSVLISDDQPFRLEQSRFVLANTQERVDFPLRDGEICYAARVEGRSSLARCGILVHFTAPTIHAGFAGTITLEIINLGFAPFLLRPGLPICQLIVEEVRGQPALAPNQFKGQTTPEGLSPSPRA
jgi:dCTP deaminase